MKLDRIITKYLALGLKVLKADKNKTAATIAALPPCFEYGVIGTKAYAKPDIEAFKEYLLFIEELWAGE